MAANSPSPERVKMAIGRISSFFGVRQGQKSIDRIMTIFGVTAVPEGDKGEKIAQLLNGYYSTDTELFSSFIEALLENHILSPKEKGTLQSHLQLVGYDIVDNKVVSSSLAKETILTVGKPYDAFKIIESILLSAKKRVYIIDAHVDESLFDLYFDSLDIAVEIKVLSKFMHGKFEAIGKKFKVQHPKFEIRLSNDVHDRYVIADNRAWTFGQSLKDAGNKPVCIIEISDVPSIDAIFSNLWNKGKIVL